MSAKQSYTALRPRLPKRLGGRHIGALWGKPVEKMNLNAIRMYARHWRILARLAAPAPWNGNSAAWLRDHLDRIDTREKRRQAINGKAKAA